MGNVIEIMRGITMIRTPELWHMDGQRFLTVQVHFMIMYRASDSRNHHKLARI